MITFTPPAENLSGVVDLVLAWAVLPQALIIGLLVGAFGRRWYDAFWAVPLMLAYELFVVPGFREALVGNWMTAVIGLAPVPWALLILIVKDVRGRRYHAH